MPFFRYPFFYNPNFYNNRFSNPRMYGATDNSANGSNGSNSYSTPCVNSNKNKVQDINVTNHNNSRNSDNRSFNSDKKNNSKSNSEEENYFFELFGLKLYFDDVLLICLIFFLYQEGVKDDELFLSLVLLLLS